MDDTSFRSEVVQENGARIEYATVIHDGQEFTNLGSVITDRFISGYVKKIDGVYHLTTWNGEPIMRLVISSQWKQLTWAGYRVQMYSFSGEYNGHVWAGRNQGEGILIRMRRGKLLRIGQPAEGSKAPV